MLFEPTQDMPQTLKAQLWMAATRKAMTLALKAQEQHFAPQIFEGRKQLLRLFDATA